MKTTFFNALENIREAGPRSALAVWIAGSARKVVRSMFIDVSEKLEEAGPRSTSTVCIAGSAQEAAKTKLFYLFEKH